MGRLVLLGVLLTATVAAAAPNTATIAFINSGGLQGVSADGTGLRLLRQAGCTPGTSPPCPDAKAVSWSPDGTRLAAVIGAQLYLLDSRDGSQRLLTTGVPVNGDSPPAWAPDGRRLAFLDLDVIDGFGTLSDLYVLDLASDGVRRLTNGREVTDPDWAPAKQIVFSNAVSHRADLIVADPDTGDLRQLTESETDVVNRRPSWSPDGTQVAFVNLRRGGGPGRLQAIGADGRNRRTLSAAPIDVAFGHRPVWSPDGSRIAFSTLLNGRPSPISEQVIGRDLYVVGADGKGERRLTESAERGFTDRDPSWSPDGSQLAFESYDRDAPAKSTIYAVNADGTCEQPLAPIAGWAPDWQPLAGAATAPRECADLSVIAKSVKSSGLVGRAVVTVLNDGTNPLANVEVHSASTAATVRAATAPVGTCSVDRGSFSCRLGALVPGDSVEVAVQAESRVVTRAGASLVLGGKIAYFARAGELDAQLSNNTLTVELATARCTSRTRGGGVIKGTLLDDHVCGRRGRDVIDAAAGRDRIDAGSGNDFIEARDNDPDDIRCGAGVDRVFADRSDRVAADCEHVSHAPR